MTAYQTPLGMSPYQIFFSKLHSRWDGPFVITNVFPYGVVELKDETTNSTFQDEIRVKDRLGMGVARHPIRLPLGSYPTRVCLSLLRTPPSLEGSKSTEDFHLGVPDMVGPEFMGARLGDQGAKAELYLRHPLTK
ncbi:hypothetical protein CR513_28040, partial [Mucuna pruriens]